MFAIGLGYTTGAICCGGNIGSVWIFHSCETVPIKDNNKNNPMVAQTKHEIVNAFTVDKSESSDMLLKVFLSQAAITTE